MGLLVFQSMANQKQNSWRTNFWGAANQTELEMGNAQELTEQINSTQGQYEQTGLCLSWGICKIINALNYKILYKQERNEITHFKKYIIRNALKCQKYWSSKKYCSFNFEFYLYSVAFSPNKSAKWNTHIY